jgi:hypothetical protein
MLTNNPSLGSLWTLRVSKVEWLCSSTTADSGPVIVDPITNAVTIPAPTSTTNAVAGALILLADWEAAPQLFSDLKVSSITSGDTLFIHIR